MIKNWLRLALSLGLAMGVAAEACAARPLVRAEKRNTPFSANLPACDDPGVLGTIASRFQQKESLFWHSQLQIVDYDHIRESGFRSNGLDYIPRRYCTARASLSDKRRHAVVYWIGDKLGIIGTGYGVEWCVVGLDRNDAFAPNCREARH